MRFFVSDQRLRRFLTLFEAPELPELFDSLGRLTFEGLGFFLSALSDERFVPRFDRELIFFSVFSSVASAFSLEGFAASSAAASAASLASRRFSSSSSEGTQSFSSNDVRRR